MTETAVLQLQEEVLRNGYEVVDESRSDAEWIIPQDSRLPEYDETHNKLRAAGIDGDPVASFTMGEQQFAIVDVSNVERSFKTGGYKPTVGKHGHATSAEYQLDEDMPMVLVHFTRADGGRTAAQVRGIRRGESVLLGRDKRYAAQDPETFSIFDYGDDPSISRKHGVVSLDPERHTVTVTDVGSTFDTHIRYAKPPEGSVESEEAYTGDATKAAAVGGLKDVIQRRVLHASQVRSFTDSLDRDILALSRKDGPEVTTVENEFMGAVSTMSSRIVVSLLSDHYPLPQSREARDNLSTVVSKAAVLVDLIDGRDSREASAFRPVIEDINNGAHVNGYQLQVALGGLAEATVDLRRRPALRALAEDYTRSMLNLVGDMAEANRGIRMTGYLHGNLNYILQKHEQMEAARQST